MHLKLTELVYSTYQYLCTYVPHVEMSITVYDSKSIHKPINWHLNACISPSKPLELVVASYLLERSIILLPLSNTTGHFFFFPSHLLFYIYIAMFGRQIISLAALLVVGASAQFENPAGSIDIGTVGFSGSSSAGADPGDWLVSGSGQDIWVSDESVKLFGLGWGCACSLGFAIMLSGHLLALYISSSNHFTMCTSPNYTELV